MDFKLFHVVLFHLLFEIQAEVWTVGIPKRIPWVIFDGNISSPASIFDLIKSDADENTFLIDQQPIWDGGGNRMARWSTRCLELSDVCLFEFNSHSMEAFKPATNNTRIPIVSLPIVQLKPILAVRLPESTNSVVKPTDAGSARYFILPFHSSVWSMLLLFMVTVASILYLFEKTDKFKKKKNCENDWNMVDTLFCSALGLALQPYRKYPHSLAGMVLLIFWYLFSLICLIAYVCGTYVLIFRTSEDIPYRSIPAITHKQEIHCERSTSWCEHLKRNTELNVQEDSMDFWSNAIMVEQEIWLTDHITAQILRETLNKPSSWNKTERMNWYTKSINCKNMLNPVHLRPNVISFISYNSRAIWVINNRISMLNGMDKFDGINVEDICGTKSIKNHRNLVTLQQMNGPLVFMIVGALIAIFVHLSDLFYRVFLRK